MILKYYFNVVCWGILLRIDTKTFYFDITIIQKIFFDKEKKPWRDHDFKNGYAVWTSLFVLGGV